MGNVVISPNIKKESVRIDPAGNVINPRTKQIIQPVAPEYVAPPTVPEPTPLEKPKISKMDDMINKLVEKKVEAMVAKKIEEALSNL
ncbi:hypothetical protein M0R04_13855 [Candidatus Dojkabacteria bacterium]|nr:hypothetical protein [Candidatus Dojkabacteria bacterium]